MKGIWDKFYPQSVDKAELDRLFSDAGTSDLDRIGQMIGAGIISPADLSRILKGLEPLSSSEGEELATLREEHQVKIKNAKLLVFKKLHPDMRQFVINAIGWRRTMLEINNTTAPQDQRLIDLEAKNNHGRLFTQDGTRFQKWSSNHTVMDPHFFDPSQASVPLPEGITEQDLEQAHLEATLEEEMLNGQKG